MIQLYMAMSLDGFISGVDDVPGQGLGRNGGRLFNVWDDRFGDGVTGQVYGEALETGAVISGRRTYELAGHWGGDHHAGVPICVLTHHADDEAEGNATFYDDVDACAAAARTAAGDRPTMVHGAGAAQALLRAGQLDEMEIHLISVILGEGRRLFDDQHVELELTRRRSGRDVTHVRYRVHQSTS